VPADTRCRKETDLADAEIAAIVRGAAVNGTAGPFGMIDSTADCILGGGHTGDCLAWVAYVEGKPGNAWLTWGRDGRRVGWMPECPAEDCSLYLGHPGKCIPGLYQEAGDGR